MSTTAGLERPLDPASVAAPVPVTAAARSEETILLQYAEYYLRGARRQGLAVDALMEREGIPASLRGSPLARIPLPAFARLLRRLQFRMRDELMGLGSRPVRLGSFALAARRMAGCATLGEAIAAGIAVYRTATTDFEPHLRQLMIAGRPVARISLATRRVASPGTTVQSAFLYAVLAVASWLVQQRIPVLSIGLRRAGGAPPPRVEEGRRPAFGVRVHYDDDPSALSFDAHWLSEPVAVDATALDRFLEAMPAPLISPFRHRAGIKEQVRLRLRRQIGSSLPSMEQTAWSLKLSPHLLRRRLKEENESFQDIKRDVLRDVAIERLLHSDDKLAMIASELGFSECSAFHRSFKRWTGLTPGAYRGAHRPAARGGAAAPAGNPCSHGQSIDGLASMSDGTQAARLLSRASRPIQD